jgi:lipoate-protein ligase A
VRLRTLPDLTASGAVQMAVDDGLLDDVMWVTARRYRWSPPTLSLGKFQRLLSEAPTVGGGPGSGMGSLGVVTAKDESALPFDVVRRPSGGRAVLHGAGFEWSFAVVFPDGSTGAARGRVDEAYGLVSAAMTHALGVSGIDLTDVREEPYRRSALCFATSLRHDLHAAVGKVVAVAQTRRDRATLVHGSVLERRPPAELTDAVERLVGEPWRGEGLSFQPGLDADALWTWFLEALELSLDQVVAR